MNPNDLDDLADKILTPKIEKEVELNWLSGAFLGWSLCSLALMFVFFMSNFHRYVCMGSMGAGVLALMIWSIVMQMRK